jgi:hypothetical protein
LKPSLHQGGNIKVKEKEMSGIIHIEVNPLGFTQVYLIQPNAEAETNRLWKLYCALRPEIQALIGRAKEEAPYLLTDGETEKEALRK